MGKFEDLLERATEQQQTLYEISSDWNLYKKDEHIFLRNYVGYAMFGPPMCTNQMTDNDLYIYKDQQVEAIEYIISKIIKYGTYNSSTDTQRKDKNETEKLSCDGNIYCIVLYNVIFPYKKTITKFEKFRCDVEKLKQDINMARNNDQKRRYEERIKKYEKDLEEREKQISCIYSVPVFKIKRKNKNDEISACFIDVNGRIYKNWEDYLRNNTLHECTMVLPKNGEYQPDPNKQCTEHSSWVWIECHQSPKCSKKIVSLLNKASTVLSVGTIAVSAASILTPLAPITVSAVLLSATASGLWGIGRSSANLVDRKKHKESICDKKAVESWITIGSCTLGILSLGSSMLLSRAVRSGTNIGKVARSTHKIINGSSIAVNVVGIACKSYGMLSTNEKVTIKDITFFMCDLFFLCNSVVNLRLAAKIVRYGQAEVVEDYKNLLRSNRHENSFIRLTQNTTDNTEIVRVVNKCSSRYDFLATMAQGLMQINSAEFPMELLERSIMAFLSVTVLRDELKPQITADIVRTFLPVFIEIRKVIPKQYETIYLAFLDLAIKLCHHISRRGIVTGCLTVLVEYLWEKIKEALKINPNTSSTEVQEIMLYLFHPLTEKLDHLVAEFQEYVSKTHKVPIEYHNVQ